MADPEINVICEILASRPRPTGRDKRRKRLDALGGQYSLPADVQVDAVDTNVVPAEWTRSPGADPLRVILLLHGGGYVSGSIDSRRHMNAQEGREAQERTLARGHRLAPEHPFPEASNDTIAGYRFLLARGLHPSASPWPVRVPEVA